MKDATAPIYDYTAGRRPLVDALGDIRAGLARHRLAHEMARRDFRNRYKGAVIGGLWMTITTGLTALGLGLLYGKLLGHPIKDHLPYVAVGLVIWGTISGAITEGSRTFLTGADMFKQMRTPLSIFAFRGSIRGGYSLLYRSFALVPVFLFAGLPSIGGTLLAGLGVIWVFFTGYWVSLLLGVLTARFRDIGQMAAAASSFAFFLTPIIWRVDRLGEYAHWVHWNPFYHYLEIVRTPLLGAEGLMFHWIVAVAITSGLAALAFGVYARFFRRLPYWC
ncbi:MAG: ABC transporter permease [Pseudomonadota bacterium]